GLFIWNDNNTPEDESDDYYKSSIPPSNDQDKRNVGQVLLIDRNGEEVTNTIFSMVEDNNRQIWLGTDKGVLVNYQPSSVFSQDVPTFSQIKIPRDDGYADYLLGGDAVSAIAVDAGNRKWLRTQGSGVILVSPDGTKQLESFDVTNSALPSNFITAITIDDRTGEVFFATSEGVVSYKGRATQGAGSFSKIYAFPNPVRPDYSGTITITGLMTNSNVKITDTAGKLVFETTSVGGQAFWDGRSFHGIEVKSGVYLVFVASEDGKSSGVTKIAIIR
ncbi:MAG TPA: two-component regulator propeller domain-containing protein, partial [Marinilabiliaceae bacterium]|nr:two-component regulator propeller domain-containing protein [Marinilabiliaceae bacterium]